MDVQNGDLRFVVQDIHESYRVKTLYTKEPGTIAWLRATLKPGDVFYDIGANIGCYSLVAAPLVGPTGHVYAFEPHLVNAASLLRNIHANALGDVITVVTTPLGARNSAQPFYYHSLRAGSSGHQLGQPVDEQGQAFVPAATILAQSMRVAELGLRAPRVVKIDVDGHELEVLQGMVFGSRLRTLQVEAHGAVHRAAITEFLLHRGYRLASRHYTKAGQQAVDAGADPDAVTDNAIFAMVAA